MRYILKKVYGNDKNISRVFKLYEYLFTLKQGNMSVFVYYSALRGTLHELKGTLHELKVHQDHKNLRQYC